MFAPAKVSTGSAWGKDDGVEICLAGQTPDGKPATFVVRGYRGRHGAKRHRRGRIRGGGSTAGQGRAFRRQARPRASGTSLRGWRGEWAIPFAALGLKPAPGLKVAFNMGAFCSEFGEWHCWEGTLAENWRLDQAGTIQLGEPNDTLQTMAQRR